MKLDKVQEAILTYQTYEPVGKYGVTGLERPRYQEWVRLQNPDVDCTEPVGYIDSKIGTGFHKIAEEAMSNSNINCDTEIKLKANIGGYEVGGTCDLVLWEDGVATVCDFKTMKAYPAKKAFNGEELDKFIRQLSLYAYMIRHTPNLLGSNTTNKVGYIYVFVTGWTARDRNLPRTFRLELELLDDKEVEEYVKDRIQQLENPSMDCPTWLCEKYCSVNCVCPHFNNHEFKDTTK